MNIVLRVRGLVFEHLDPTHFNRDFELDFHDGGLGLWRISADIILLKRTT